MEPQTSFELESPNALQTIDLKETSETSLVKSVPVAPTHPTEAQDANNNLPEKSQLEDAYNQKDVDNLQQVEAETSPTIKTKYAYNGEKLILPPVPQPRNPEASSVNSDSASMRSSLSRRSSVVGPPPTRRLLFHTALVYVFITGMVLFIPIMIFQVAVLGLYYNGDLTSASSDNGESGTWAYIFNLLCTSWFIFGIFYGGSYAPSTTIVIVCVGLTALASLLGSVIAYFVYDGVIMLLFLLPSVGFFSILPFSQKIYSLISTLPVQELALQSWLTSFRYFAIVCAPILINCIKTGSSTLLSYFAIVLFCLGVASFNAVVRVHLCLPPFMPEGVSQLFGQLTVRQLLTAYGPPFSLLVIFAILYVLDLSGVYVSNTFIYVMAAITIVLVTFQAVFLFSFISRWSLLSFINPFTGADYSLLEGARVKGLAVRDLGVSPTIFHGPLATLRQRREDLQHSLHIIETTIANLQPGLSLVDLTIYIFFAGMVLTLPVLLAEIILLGQGEMEVALSIPFFIFNLLASSWMIFGLLMGVSYSPSPKLIGMLFVVFAFECALLAGWAYFAFGVIACVMYTLLGLALLFAIPVVDRLYQQICCLPVEDNTLNQWFTTWRFFGVVTAPIIARYVYNNEASQVSFYALMVFSMGLSYYCGILRVHFAAKLLVKRGGVAALFQRINMIQLTQLYSPVIIMMIVFAILYLIDASGYGSSISDSAIIILLIVFVVCMVTFLTWMIAFCRFGIFAHFNPFLQEDYKILDSLLEKTRKTHEDRLSAPLAQLGELRQQRKDQRRQLNDVEVEIAATAPDDETKGIPLTTLIVYGYMICIVLSIIVWFAEMGLIGTGAEKVQLKGLWVFNLIMNGVMILGAFFVVLYGPSARFIFASCSLTFVAFILDGVWAYVVFGVPAMLFFFFIGLNFLLIGFASKPLFLKVSLLPTEDLTIQVFFTSVRFFILVVTPFVVECVQAGRGSQVGFFAVIFFCTGTMYLTYIVRVWSAIHPASRTVSSLMRQHSTRQIVQQFFPFFVVILVFAVYYIIDISSSSFSVSDTTLYTLLIIGAISVGSFTFNTMIFILRPRTAWLAIFNLHTSEDYNWLHAARARTKDIISERTPRLRSSSIVAMPPI